MKEDRYRIGKVFINITNHEHTKSKIREAVKIGINGYICVSNMRTVCIANKDKDYQKVMEDSFMNIPDGTPLVWCGRAWGCKEAQRSSGPDLFVSMLEEKNSNIKHFLLGDTEETLNKIKEKYPEANIVGSYSPPFKPLQEYDLEYISNIINQSNADIVWTSLRAPKQDILGNMLMPYVHNKLFIGVGAAFRVALGEFKLPPEWIRKLGLSGFWLRGKNSIKMIGWYFNTSIFLINNILCISKDKFIGKKYYE